MEHSYINTENCEPLLTTPFLNVYDLQYAAGKHYYNATRHSQKDLIACKSDPEVRKMLPDAVTCAVVIHQSNCEPKLLMSYEYRYPIGRYLLSPPAGLLDAEDKETANPVISAAIREIKEETGLAIQEGDSVEIVAPVLFSSPGMTDESNAVAAAHVHIEDLSQLTHAGAVGGEQFSGFLLLTREEARSILKAGKDAEGIFYSVWAWVVLSWFCDS